MSDPNIAASSLSDVATQLVEESAADLKASLEKLGPITKPLMDKTKDLAILAIQVYSAKLNGKNTAVAEIAMKSIVANLQAAGTIYAATETMAFVEKILDNLKKSLLVITTVSIL